MDPQQMQHLLGPLLNLLLEKEPGPALLLPGTRQKTLDWKAMR
jgi:hypothetical protein